jgi:hypothetical protein
MMCKWNPMKRWGSFNDLLNEKATMIKDNVTISSRHVDNVE